MKHELVHGARVAEAGDPAKPESFSTPFASTERIDCANSGPSAASTRCAGSVGANRAATRPLCLRVKVTSGRDKAARVKTASQWANSVASLLRNLRRAGVL